VVLNAVLNQVVLNAVVLNQVVLNVVVLNQVVLNVVVLNQVVLYAVVGDVVDVVNEEEKVVDAKDIFADEVVLDQTEFKRWIEYSE
jgi:hypothetical protein